MTVNHWQEELNKLRDEVQQEILNIPSLNTIPLFYEPIRYVNNLSGKKLRPLLSLLFGFNLGATLNELIYSASALELLHNFTLVHDDIMDNDDTRRGKPTVHVKWDVGTAILAGDGLIGLAYKKILQGNSKKTVSLLSLFTNAMLEICEGQALDKMFETQKQVSESRYLEMIGKKTATLIGLSCEMGSTIGGGDQKQIDSARIFGFNIGMGFQIQDDLLDVIADENKLGKKIGSDLFMNKKTILSIKLAEKVTEPLPESLTIEEYRSLLNQNGIIKQVVEMIDSYFSSALKQLDCLPDNQYKKIILHLSEYIKSRDK
jgi:geranylgeranyl diphosphate synthase type II